MAIRDFISQRLYVDAVFEKGSSITANREQANYLLNVLRLENGSNVPLFNGRNGEWVARIRVTGRKKCELDLLEQTRPQPQSSRLIYCFAPLKQARIDYMVQKAVEMGVGVLQPVITQYTQVRSIKHERLFANAVEAAEQCGILNLPAIREPIPLLQIQEAIGDSPLIFCDEQASDLDELGDREVDTDIGVALLIGPEGGFSDEERKFLNSLDFTFRLGLGPRILRADTAAVAALAILQSRIGDWYPEKLR